MGHTKAEFEEGDREVEKMIQDRGKQTVTLPAKPETPTQDFMLQRGRELAARQGVKQNTDLSGKA
jgi:hypothetical protein